MIRDKILESVAKLKSGKTFIQDAMINEIEGLREESLGGWLNYDE